MPRRPIIAALLQRDLAFSLLAIILIFVLIGTGWAYLIARRALPQVDGTISVQGLTAPVQVIRDAQGLPHITAENLDDLFFAQGYVAASDPRRDGQAIAS